MLRPPVESAQFTSWVFGETIRTAGLLPSFGTVGDGLDNAMMESFWSSMQIELLNRRKWRTRVELANAIFDYIEILSRYAGDPFPGRPGAGAGLTFVIGDCRWPSHHAWFVPAVLVEAS